MHFRDVLLRESRRNPSANAFIYRDAKITFSELRNRSLRLANALYATGVRRGDRVGVLLYNCLEYPEILWANFVLGSVAVTLNFRLASEEIVYANDVAQMKVLLYGSEFDAALAPIEDRLHGIEQLVAIGPSQLDGHVTYSSLVEKARCEPPPFDGQDSDPGVILFTSGTMGFPKAVVLSHRNLMTAAMLWACDHGIEPGDNCLVVTPFYHIGAVGYHLAHAIRGAATTCFPQRSWDPEVFLKTVQKERNTFLYITPQMYREVFSVPGFFDYDLCSWKTCITGSTSVPKATIDEMSEHLPYGTIYNAYGLTEAAGPTVATSRGESAKIKAPSVGRPFLNTDYRIMDENFQECPPGSIGEIAVKGDQIMQEYFNDAEATRKAIKEEWLYTGDLGYVDDDGFLYVVDRKKDIIITGGENVSSVEVESTLYKCPKVMDAACIGIPDEKYGEAICAVIVPKQNEHLTEDEIICFCKENLASYKKPRKIFFCDCLPKNPSGKVLKRKLRETYSSS